MESNGKSVDKDSQKMTQKTAAVVWGSEGTNAQHSFFQLLHQGTSVIPCDFLIAAVSDEEFAGHQEVLLANCLAQARALMTGRSLQKTTKRLSDLGLSAQNASRALASMEEDLLSVVQDGRLVEVKGIGKGMSTKLSFKGLFGTSIALINGVLN